MLDIVASSDFHGHLPEITKPFDLMLLAGDLEPAYNHTWGFQKNWYKESFLPWIEKLPFKDVWSKVVFTSGNHSVYLAQEGHSYRVRELESDSAGRLIYLHNELYNFDYLDEDEGIKTLTIFGTPYCKTFGNWWNMLDDKYLKIKYSEIPNNLDILLSHDCPYGACDMCFGWLAWGRTPEHIGNKVLRDIILEKHPKYCLCGHLHTGNHEWEQFGDTQVRQVSYLNENYTPTFDPYYFKWNDQVVQDGDLQ